MKQPKTKQEFIDSTMTAAQLRKMLGMLPPKTKVFISSDSEGNSYGTLDSQWLMQYSKQDNTVSLMQFCDHLTDEEIMPKQHEQIVKELKAEGRWDSIVEARAS